MKIRKVLLLCLILCFTAGYAQKIKQVSGSLSPLKGEKVVNLQYKYAGMKVGRMTEADYIKKKVDQYNKDEAGKGDKWQAAWVEDRAARYQPKFEELFNKYIEGAKMEASEGATNAKYTLIVETVMTDPGFNVGVTRKPALLNAVIYLIETANPDKVLSQTTIQKVTGQDMMGFDYDSGVRIQETYAKLGKAFGKFILKGIK